MAGRLIAANLGSSAAYSDVVAKLKSTSKSAASKNVPGSPAVSAGVARKKVRNATAIKAKLRSVVDTGNDTVANEAREDIRLGFLIHDVSRMRRSAYDQL